MSRLGAATTVLAAVLITYGAVLTAACAYGVITH